MPGRILSKLVFSIGKYTGYTWVRKPLKGLAFLFSEFWQKICFQAGAYDTSFECLPGCDW